MGQLYIKGIAIILIGIQQMIEYNYSLHLLSLFVVSVTAAIVLFRKFRKGSTNQQETDFSWSISSNNFYQHQSVKHGSQITKLKKENLSEISYLSIGQKTCDIMKEIVNWDIQKLNRLYLRDNNIQSIQQINRINMPVLEVLVLSDNRITSLKSLRRLPTLNLIWLQLQNNPLSQELNALSEMSLLNLHYMWVQFFSTDKQFNNDLTWLSKCQSIILTKFYSSSAKRIGVQRFIDTLSRKYFNFDIKMHDN